MFHILLHLEDASRNLDMEIMTKDLCLSMHNDEVLHWGFIFAPKEVKFCMSHPCPWGNEAIMLLISEPNSLLPLFAFLLKKTGQKLAFFTKIPKNGKS